MSNHADSYLLNDLLKKIAARRIFEKLGQTKTRAFLKKVLEISNKYDCNQNEVLEDLGKKLGICKECLRFDKIIKEDLCPKCQIEWGI
jgi:hypothetical protein